MKYKDQKQAERIAEATQQQNKILLQQIQEQRMQVVRNGGVNESVNFAVEDFYLAARILKRVTTDYTVAFTELPRGSQYFVQQQFFRLNGAGKMLDALGFQAVTEIMACLHRDASDYMMKTMAGWNKIIEEEGDIPKLFDQIAAEEQAAATPPEAIH